MTLTQEMLEQVPLHDEMAEEAILGWIIGSKGLQQRQITESVQEDWFYFKHYRTLYRFMRLQVMRLGTCDLITLKHDLERSGVLEDFGFEERLIRLCEGGFRHSATPETAAYVIRENWRLRSIDEAGLELQRLVRSGIEPEQIVQGSCKVVQSVLIGGGKKLLDIAEVDLETERESGVPTGFRSIDRYTGYLGFVTAQTSVVAAYHKGGKTAFMLQCAKALLDRGKTVVYATFADLTAAQLKRRLLKQMCGASKQPDTADMFADSFGDALGFLNDVFKDGSLRIFVGAIHGRYVEDLSAKVMELSVETPVDAVFVDYAQKLRSRERGARDNKTSELEYASDALKSMAEDANCSVIVGSQITKGNAKGEQMTKYARAIEEDAGLVLNIGEKDPSGRVTIDIPYNRFGPAGHAEFMWNPKLVRFEEVEE